MQLFTYTKPKMIVSDEGKHIRDVNDVYVAEHYDKEGNLIPQKKPYYASIIFLADNIDTSKINELYVEEDIEKE